MRSLHTRVDVHGCVAVDILSSCYRGAAVPMDQYTPMYVDSEQASLARELKPKLSAYNNKHTNARTGNGCSSMRSYLDNQ